MKNYILNLYTGSNQFEKPVHYKGFDYATNSSIAIKYKSDEAENKEEFSVCSRVFDVKFKKIQGIYKLEDIYKDLAAFKYKYESLPCKECHGIGEVECVHCNSIIKCEECEGTGEGYDKKYSRLKHRNYEDIKIGEHYFNPNFINTLALTASILGVNELEFSNCEQMLYCKLNKEVEVIIMALKK